MTPRSVIALAVAMLLLLALALQHQAALSSLLAAPQALHATLQQGAPLQRADAAAALAACHAQRGHGVAHYAALADGGVGGARRAGAAAAAAQAGDASCATEQRGNASVTHCCLVRFAFQGRSGNILTQYAAGRYFAELNSCAMAGVVFASPHEPHPAMGDQGSPSAWHLQWPPAAGFTPHYEQTLLNPIEAYAFHRVDYGGTLTLAVYPEQANWQYSALSLGWDLAGGTLMGSGLRGLNQRLTSSASVMDRCARWARHREACAVAGVQLLQQQRATAPLPEAAPAPAHQQPPQQHTRLMQQAIDTVLEGLHPWLPSQVRSDIVALLQGAAASTPSTPAAAAAAMSPGLATFLNNPERTIVLHVRLDDLYAGTLASCASRSARGQGSHASQRAGLHSAMDWLGAPEGRQQRQRQRSLGSSSSSSSSALPASHVLEMLEASAAGLSNSVAPLSYYQAVLRGTGAARAWDHVLVVGDASLASNPLFQALAREFNATLQTSTAALDMAVLVLARQLVVSGGSTFSFTAAALGRARVIHAPHMGLMGLTSTPQTCFVTPSALDGWWVFHDVFRGAVRRVARGYAAQAGAGAGEGLGAEAVVGREWALRASGGVWREHVEWKRQPMLEALPSWEAAVAGGCSGGEEGEGEGVWGKGYGRAVGREDTAAEDASSSSSSSSSSSATPLYFLTYQQLVEYYRHPACARYFYPSAARSRDEAGIDPGARWETCTDKVSMAPLKEGGFGGLNCRVDGKWAQPCEG